MPETSYTRAIRDMVVKGVYGLGAGVVADFIIEFFQIPVLHNRGLFGNHKQSNYEIIAYALSAGGATAGIIDMTTNSKPLGFSKDFTPAFIGFGFGTVLYENFVSPTLGLKKYDPYKFVYNMVPSVPLL